MTNVWVKYIVKTLTINEQLLLFSLSLLFTHVDYIFKDLQRYETFPSRCTATEIYSISLYDVNNLSRP